MPGALAAAIRPAAPHDHQYRGDAVWDRVDEPCLKICEAKRLDDLRLPHRKDAAGRRSSCANQRHREEVLVPCQLPKRDVSDGLLASRFFIEAPDEPRALCVAQPSCLTGL